MEDLTIPINVHIGLRCLCFLRIFALTRTKLRKEALFLPH